MMAAGPLPEGESEMIGSFMLVEASSLAEVQAFHEGDSFSKAGLFKTVSLPRWEPHEA